MRNRSADSRLETLLARLLKTAHAFPAPSTRHLPPGQKRLQAMTVRQLVHEVVKTTRHNEIDRVQMLSDEFVNRGLLLAGAVLLTGVETESAIEEEVFNDEHSRSELTFEGINRAFDAFFAPAEFAMPKVTASAHLLVDDMAALNVDEDVLNAFEFAANITPENPSAALSAQFELTHPTQTVQTATVNEETTSQLEL